MAPCLDPTPWRLHLQAHLPRAQRGEDPEGVHQVRVAARRLRVFLDLAGYRVLRDDLAWLIRKAGRVRDLEVLLGMDPPEALARWLREEREGAHRALVEALEAPRLGGLLEALAHLPPLPPAGAWPRLLRLERRVKRLRRGLDGTPEALHAFRRALRRLRYAREYLGQDTRALKALQEALGRLQDLEVALAYLEVYEAGHPPLPEYRRRLQEARAAALQGVRLGLGQGL